MPTGTQLLEQVLNGLTIGMVYVLVAAGLSIIFGVMDVLNISHGELLALGAYFTFALTTRVGSTGFWIALVAVPLLVAVVGMALERFAIRRIYGRSGHLSHILLTFGILLIIYDTKTILWGKNSKFVATPTVLHQPLEVLGFGYSAYNYFVIVTGVVLALVAWGLLRYTKFGLVVRAGSQDRKMVRNLGIDIDRYYTLVFGFGAALAGFGGVVLGGYQNVNLEMGNSVIIPAFVIVVIGGLGSFRGAVVGGLGVGIIQSFVSTYLPQFQGIVIFLVMIGLLLVRPHGLFGDPGWSSPRTGDEEGFLTGTASGLVDDRVRTWLGVAAVAGLALVPFGVGTFYTPYMITLLSEILVWGLFALSLDIVLGYAGLISLGHAMFWGMGSYVVMLTFIHLSGSVLVAVALAVLVCAAVAWVVGHLAIRVSGVYFVMITLAFAEVVANVIERWDFTGGSNGLFGGRDPFYGVAGVGTHLEDIKVTLPGVVLTDDELFFYLLIAVVVAAYLLARRVMHSPFGSVLESIRESENRSTFVGYDTRAFKRRAFVVSGAVAGLAGGLHALHQGFAAPRFLHWINSGDVIVMAVLGGVGTLFGPMLGAGVFLGVEEYVSSVFPYWRLVLGVFFVLVVLLLPKGLVSLPGRLRQLFSTEAPAEDRLPEETEVEN